MLCALTVRTLKPGSFEDFREAFTSVMDPGKPPEGWSRFNMLRNAQNPEEVVCFGFYDGTIEQLRASETDLGYDEQQRAIAPFVESVGTDGLFEVAVEYTA
jgi:heme-degrading monooxygenase HmoA